MVRIQRGVNIINAKGIVLSYQMKKKNNEFTCNVQYEKKIADLIICFLLCWEFFVLYVTVALL